MPRHVSDKLLKLHGIGFKGKKLVIEKTATPEEYSYDAVIIHVGINGILRSKHLDKLEK